MRYKTKIYGHRGYSEKYPENTMTAFLKAHECGANGIETDVQRTQDGYLVLAHDEYVDRVSNGKGKICEMTLAELRILSFNKLIPECPDGRIPLLTDLLDAFKETLFMINLELKNSIEPYPGMEEEVISLVKEYGMLGQFIFSSFNHESIVKIKQICPEAQTGFLVGGEILAEPEKYISGYGVNAYHPYYIGLRTQEDINKMHRSGIEINTWTVNMGSMIRKLCDWEVDGIITNRVELGCEIRDDKSTLLTVSN